MLNRELIKCTAKLNIWCHVASNKTVITFIMKWRRTNEMYIAYTRKFSQLIQLCWMYIAQRNPKEKKKQKWNRLILWTPYRFEFWIRYIHFFSLTICERCWISKKKNISKTESRHTCCQHIILCTLHCNLSVRYEENEPARQHKDSILKA